MRSRPIKIGFGASAPLIFMAPLVLLFSYTRTHKNRVFDAGIPFVGVVLIIFVYLESFYQGLKMLFPISI